MVAAVSKPEFCPPLSMSYQDKSDVSWFSGWDVAEDSSWGSADGDVGGLRSGNLEKGGTFSVVDHEKITDRQMRAAKRHRKVTAIMAQVPQEHRNILALYWSHQGDRARVENERSRNDGVNHVAPLTAGEQELRLCSIYPWTPTAQAAGAALADQERVEDRARRVAASPLKLVGGTEMSEANAEREAASPLNVDGDQADPEAQPRMKIRLDNGDIVEADEEASRAMLVFARGEGDCPGSLGYAIRLQGAVSEWHRRRVQGTWKAPALAVDQLRDAAVRALRHAEHSQDLVFLRAVRKEARAAYDRAQDAYVRARRMVKGKDGEERRQEKADRWVTANACTEVRLKSSNVLDMAKALSRSSRVAE